MAGPGGIGLPNPKSKRNRQMLIYLGAAGAVLLLILLSRRGQQAATAQPDPGGPAVPVSSPASDGLSDTGGGVDNSAQLASFESALLNQLPDSISSGLAAGLANGSTLPADSTDGGQTPAGGAVDSGDVASILTAAGALVTTGATLGGAQHGEGHSTAKSNGGKKKQKPRAHPATPRGGRKPQPAKPTHPAKPKPKAQPPHVDRHPADKHKKKR
jgi:hypothetical protein